MSQPYNPRLVVERTPNALLRKFLSHHPAFTDLDWTKLAESDAEPVLQRIHKTDEESAQRIGFRFRQVHKLADSRGTTTLIAAAGEKGEELAGYLQSMRNGYERAFWCLVEHPQLFDSELVYAYTFSIRKASRETRVGFPVGKIEITEEMLVGIKEHVQTTFKSEHRAHKCRMDHRYNAGVHLIEASPSDYTDEIDAYGDGEQIIGLSVTRPFPVVYYLDESTGSVTVLTKGGAHKVDALFEGFGVTIFQLSAPPKAGKKSYDLSLFKNPNFEFNADAADQLQLLRVTAMKIHFPGAPHHKATYEVDPDDPQDNVYDLIRAELRGEIGKLMRSTIRSVTLQATFGNADGSTEVIQFRITEPRWCNLGCEGREGILRRYLRLWGIECDGKRVAALPEPTRVA